MTDAKLPALRDVISRYGLAAKHKLGQHFLLDANLLDRIVRAAGDLTGRHVVEVGPGPGGLTRALLASAAASVTAVEIDTRAISALGELVTLFGDRFSLIAGDALAFDLAEKIPAPRQIVANLPYNVGSPLLVSWLRQAASWERMTLMFQQEVADRLCAPPATPAYGRLGVLAQWTCAVDLAFGGGTVDPACGATAGRFVHRDGTADRSCIRPAAQNAARVAEKLRRGGPARQRRHCG
jgi:16S rRNA (adenine1518-N6/adenine1519-N6)-dimethyltransferase